MAGESITNARTAAAALVDKLNPADDFSSEATLKVPDGPVGPRRDAIKKVIADIHEGGGTNIGDALTMGYAQASAKTIPEDAVRVVLLLSDGHANEGVTAPDRLSKLALDAFQKGIQTSSFGLGPDYDGALMSAIAAEGAGGTTTSATPSRSPPRWPPRSTSASTPSPPPSRSASASRRT
jgi:Ca-activated chloride channel family protein